MSAQTIWTFPTKGDPSAPTIVDGWILIDTSMGKLDWIGGGTDWSIRTNGGVSYPVGQHDAYLRHTDKGCYVYGGNGWDADGRPVYYIGGPGSVDGPGT